MRPNLKSKCFKTQIGDFLLESSPKGLYAVRFPPFPHNVRRATRNEFILGSHVERCALSVAPVRKCLTSLLYKLRGRKLDLSGYTPFQLKVYAALRKVPAGKVVTYGELAKRAGYPGAARAVGTAMKKNRLPIVIPCHRVVPATGGLGEYSAGKCWKRWLLEHEGFFAQRTTRKAQR